MADMQIVEAVRKGVEKAPSSMVTNKRSDLLEVFKALDEAKANAERVATAKEQE